MAKQRYISIVFSLIFLFIGIEHTNAVFAGSNTSLDYSNEHNGLYKKPTDGKIYPSSLGSENYLRISPNNSKSHISIEVSYPKDSGWKPSQIAIEDAMKELVKNVEALRSYFNKKNQQVVVDFDKLSPLCCTLEGISAEPSLTDPLKPKIQLQFIPNDEFLIMKLGIPHEIADGKSAFLGLLLFFDYYIKNSSFPYNIIGKVIKWWSGLKLPDDFSLNESVKYATIQRQNLESFLESYNQKETENEACSFLKNASPNQPYGLQSSEGKLDDWTSHTVVIEKPKIDSVLEALKNSKSELLKKKKPMMIEHLLELLVAFNKGDCSVRRASSGRNHDNKNAFGYFASSQIDNVLIGSESKTASDIILELIEARKVYEDTGLKYIPVETLVEKKILTAPQVGVNFLGKIGSPKPPVTELLLAQLLGMNVKTDFTVGDWFDNEGIYDIRMDIQGSERINGDVEFKFSGDKSAEDDPKKLLNLFPKFLDILIENPNTTVKEYKERLFD